MLPSHSRLFPDICLLQATPWQRLMCIDNKPDEKSIFKRSTCTPTPTYLIHLCSCMSVFMHADVFSSPFVRAFIISLPPSLWIRAPKPEREIRKNQRRRGEGETCREQNGGGTRGETAGDTAKRTKPTVDSGADPAHQFVFANLGLISLICYERCAETPRMTYLFRKSKNYFLFGEESALRV